MEDITATVSPEPIYTPDAVVVINTNDVFSTVSPVLMTAREISSMFRQKENLSSKNDAMNKRVANVREYLIENYEELDDHADEIAKLLGIDLSASIEIEVSVTFNATISLPIGKTIDDLSEYDFDADLICNEPDYEIESVSANINSVYEVS